MEEVSRKTDRILWIDWIKFLAIFGVIGVHISSSLLTKSTVFTFNWYQAVIISSLFRFAIILFVMASGYLLLRKIQPIIIIPKRLKRILLPFIFWLIVYAIVKVAVVGVLGLTWNIYDLIKYILMAFLNPLDVSIQFWYVYMILGLYLLSPLLSRWIHDAPINEIEYILIIWVIISLIQFTRIETVLLDYLRYFTGCIGYFILGYYLTIKDSHVLKNRRFGLLLFIVGTLITILGTVIMSHIMGSQSLFFIRLGDITPGSCLQAIGLFIILTNTQLDNFDLMINRLVVHYSKSSYGIYLINILVIHILDKVNLLPLNILTPFTVFCTIIITMVISDIMIMIMNRIHVLQKFSG